MDPILLSGKAGPLVMTSASRRLAIAGDGIVWKIQPRAAFPVGWSLADIEVSGSASWPSDGRHEVRRTNFRCGRHGRATHSPLSSDRLDADPPA